MTIQNVNTRNASPGFAYLVMIFIYFTNAKRKKKKINLGSSFEILSGAK